MDWRTARASYDRVAHRYDDVFAHLQRPKIDALMRLVGDVPLDAPVVDVGAGTGLFARSTGLVCVEIDASFAMLTSPKRLGCVQAKSDALPFADERFGTLVSVTSLIDYARGEGTLREWARVVRPGGRVLLSVLLREDLVSVDADMVAAGFTLDAFEIAGQDRVSVWTRARGLSIMPP